MDVGSSGNYQTTGPVARVRIGATVSNRPPLMIDQASLIVTPVAMGWEVTNTHVYWTDAGGTRHQLDQQTGTGGTSIYTTDDDFTGTRTANLDGFSLTFTNAGLFRIIHTVAGDGTYDFNQGVDFLNYDADFSVNYTQTVLDGIKLNVTDLATTDEINFEVKATGIFATLDNVTSQNRLVGVDNTTGALGNITIGSGLSLASGVLSATGGAGGSASTTFDATTDWGSPSGGFYSFAFNHSLGSDDVIVMIWDETSTPVQVIPDTVERTDNNTVTIRVTETPDNRFAGRIVVKS
jgi:hypothetical protein